MVQIEERIRTIESELRGLREAEEYFLNIREMVRYSMETISQMGAMPPPYNQAIANHQTRVDIQAIGASMIARARTGIVHRERLLRILREESRANEGRAGDDQ